MNIEDLLDGRDLQQDEWSLKRLTFGTEGQLQVVGWNGKRKTHKFYILKCSKCSQDNELFGEGLFRSNKHNLINGKVPCGCSERISWTREQYNILCSRKADELGYKFLGFAAEWKDNKTNIVMFCEKHGEWHTGNIAMLVHTGSGCPECRKGSSAKPDEVMIKSFLASGAFHPDTKFWRSDRGTLEGWKLYWHMSCPECGVVGESFCGNLQRGQRPCACSPHRQQECYINTVNDYTGPIALKFGIARNSRVRTKIQDRLSSYEVHLHSVYTFGSVDSCKKAEKDCKQELECSVLTKEEMPDGYTETTWVYNLDKIIEIYERNGGILKQNA